MKEKPPSDLKPIIGMWMTIPKQVAMALRQLVTRYSYFSIGEMFGIAACISVMTSERFLKFFLIVAISLN